MESKDKSWEAYANRKRNVTDKRQTTTAMFRLETGHDLLAKHLHRFGIINSDICKLCSNGVQDRQHLLVCAKLKDVTDEMPKGMNRNEREAYLYWAARRMMTL